MYEFLESLDTSKFGRFFKVFLAPLWLLLEYICYRKYWKIILSELLGTPEICDLLNKNFFGLYHGRLVKKDLIDDNEYLSGRKLSECKEIIKHEYCEVLVKLISENCNTDIEELITLLVTTYTVPHKSDMDIVKVGVYEVSIQFNRYWWLSKAKHYTFAWLVGFCLLALAVLGIMFCFFNVPIHSPTYVF